MSSLKAAPGGCVHAAIAVAIVIVLALLSGHAGAEPRKKPAEKPAATAEKPGEKKEKTYTFGGLDIDGKLKTPQLLYFLNRMKSELDTTTPDKRSFIPELKRSTEEM